MLVDRKCVLSGVQIKGEELYSKDSDSGVRKEGWASDGVWKHGRMYNMYHHQKYTKSDYAV